jgi:hypothetical protein
MRNGNAQRDLVQKPEVKKLHEGLGADGRTILKWITKKETGMA